MTFAFSGWLITLIPLFLMLAGLFWGAPIIAVVSELVSMLGGKPFPARCGQQITRLAVRSHASFWLLMLGGIGLCWSGAFWSSEFVEANRLLLVCTGLLPITGSLLLIAYSASWKSAKQKRGLHFIIGCLANVPLKYGYWGLVLLCIMYFQGINPEYPTVIPPLRSPLWPFAGLWVPLSLFTAAGLALNYLLFRREQDDWGRDYYRFAAPYLAKWLMVTGVLCAAVMVWLYLSLKGFMNLALPQIAFPAIGGVIGLSLSFVLALSITTNEHPMRCKGAMLGIVVLIYGTLLCLLTAIFETMSHYLPGWSLPTFMPDLLQYLPL